MLQIPEWRLKGRSILLTALKGHATIAQGAVLARMPPLSPQALKGRHAYLGPVSRSFRATITRWNAVPGLRPGLSHLALSGQTWIETQGQISTSLVFA